MQIILQISIIWIVFYVIYFFGMKKLTFFNNNRLYLLFSLILGIVVPILAPRLIVEKPELLQFENLQTITYYASPEVIVEKTDWKNIAENILKALYFIVSITMFVRFMNGLKNIYKLYRNGTKEMIGGCEFVYNEKPHLPFSFFNKVFLSKSTSFGEELNKVIKHEIAHIKQWHTIDVMFIEILHILFWFNPILLLYKRSLKESHEYIADRYATDNENKREYINFLVNTAVSDLELSLVNSFFNSQLLNRITMLKSNQSSKKYLVRYALLLPMLAAFTYLLASSKISHLSTEISSTVNSSVNNDTIPLKNLVSKTEKMDATAKDFIDVQPIIIADCEDNDEVKCSDKILMRFLASNVKYPKSAKEDNVQGNLVVGFIVNTKGKIENPTIVKSIRPDIDAEGLKIISLLNETYTWKPGRSNGRAVDVHYALPINFRLYGVPFNTPLEEDKYEIMKKLDAVFVAGTPLEKAKKVEIKLEEKEGLQTGRKVKDESDNVKKTPFYEIDGIPLSDSDKNSIYAIKSEDIEHIDVLRDESVPTIYRSKEINSNKLLVVKKKQSEKEKDKKYIFIVNGKEMKDIELNNIGAENIKSMTVFKKSDVPVGYEGVIKIELKDNVSLEKSISIIASPNPSSKSNVNLIVTTDDRNEPVVVGIYNLAGQKLAEKTIKVLDGKTYVQFDISNLASNQQILVKGKQGKLQMSTKVIVQ